MRIAWFTPWDQKSAIGKVSVVICEELAKQHDVDIWAYETENTLKTSLRVVHYNPSSLDVRALSDYTHVVYNMGNYAGFHWAIYEALLQYPGVVILHDRTMYNFFQQYWALRYPQNPSAAQAAFSDMLRKEYGAMGVAALEQYPTLDLMGQAEQVVALSLTHSICEKATGIFTHSFAYAEELRRHTLKPVGASYLPYQPEKRKYHKLPKEFVRDPDKLLIVSNGIVHPIKHIKELADVLVKHPELRARVQYVVIGKWGGAYGDELNALAETTLRDSMFLLGYQSDEVMNSFLQEADACVNMRYPNSEVCSLSLFEQMGFAKPVIAYGSGIFCEVPDDAICTIDMEHCEESLAETLRKMIADKDAYREIGSRAERFIEEKCKPELYCSLLTSYLESLTQESVKSAYNERVLGDLRRQMQMLHYNTIEAPDALDDIAYTVGSVLNAQCSLPSVQNTIGIWVGFPYEIPCLHREGILKLMLRMVSAMLEYTAANFEIWCYAANEAEVRLNFEQLLQNEELSRRVLIVTEENWKSTLCVPKMDKGLPYSVSISADNLGTIAAKYSRAFVFIPVVLYLANVLQTKRPIFIPALDMSVKYHYEEFILQNPHYKFQMLDIESRVRRMARHGAKAYTLSRVIRDQQIIPCIPGLSAKDIETIWTPDMMTNTPSAEFSKELLSQYGISAPYLFYPTQLRPHKNIETLMQAVELLYSEYPHLQIVLTGKLADVPRVQKQWEKLRSYQNLVFVHDLTDQQLYTVYHFAACVPVSTLMEGGFPSQAIEALKLGVPTVLSDIDVVEERLTGCGLSSENCGLLLFKPEDAEDMAAKLRIALTEPQRVLAEQQAFSDTFFQYTWKEAAQKYYQMIMTARAV